jgi:16S rRNA (guanine(527)-N(7))-methyltransferase RsmG
VYAGPLSSQDLRGELQALGCDVPRETLTALETYAALLAKWQRAINLVAGNSLGDLWRRHFLDSAQLLPLLPPVSVHDGIITDLGSGAGFPGLVLAILSGRPTHLVESDQRKAAFLGEVARATGVAGRVQIHIARIEALRPWPSGIVTARALAALPELLEWAAPFLAPGAICLFPKGAKADEELTAAERVWTMKTERRRSVTDPTGLILRLSNIERRGQT